MAAESSDEARDPEKAPEQEDATVLLERISRGDRGAHDRLFELVYADLREQASAYLREERADIELDDTTLVHEAWLRMVQHDRAAPESRGHFLALAATAMRRILVDHARARTTRKRGASAAPVDLERAPFAPERDVDVLAVDEALEHLRSTSERLATIVELRFFGGLSLAGVAEALDLSRATVNREWRAARAIMSGLLEEPDREAEAVPEQRAVEEYLTEVLDRLESRLDLALERATRSQAETENVLEELERWGETSD